MRAILPLIGKVTKNIGKKGELRFFPRCWDFRQRELHLLSEEE
jgi:hypothetical protein